MSSYESQIGDQIENIIETALEYEERSIGYEEKTALALRIFELYANGITNPDYLRREVLTAHELGVDQTTLND